VAAGEGVLHPLKQFYRLKKWCQKSEKKFSKTFFVNKIFEKKNEIFWIIFKDFSPLQHPLMSHHC
jgi:hypothetical protein